MPTKTRSFTARLVIATMAVMVAVLTAGTAAAAPLPFPFSGSSGGQPVPPPPTSEPAAFFNFYVANTSGSPATISVRLANSECARDVQPNGDWYTRSIGNGEQFKDRFYVSFDEGNPLCFVSSTNASWVVETQTPRGKDRTTVRFRSYQGDNTLEWRQTTAAGKNPVFIERPFDGLEFSIR